MHGMHLHEFLRTFRRKLAWGDSHRPHHYTCFLGLQGHEKKRKQSLLSCGHQEASREGWAGLSSCGVGTLWFEDSGITVQRGTSPFGEALASRRIRNPEQARTSGKYQGSWCLSLFSHLTHHRPFSCPQCSLLKWGHQLEVVKNNSRKVKKHDSQI